MAALLALFTAGLRPASAHAQDTDPATRATVRVEAGVSRLAETWVGQAGAELLFRLDRFVEIGGAGRVDLTHPTVASEGMKLEPRFGYGGLQIALHPAPLLAPDLRIATLIGAGNLDVHDPAVDADLDSDNGLVIEPGLSWGLRVAPKLWIGASASWRFAAGFEALGGIRSEDLTGPALLAGFSLGPF